MKAEAAEKAETLAKKEDAAVKKEDAEKSTPAKESGGPAKKKENSMADKIMAEILDKEVHLNCTILQVFEVFDERVCFDLKYRKTKFYMNYLNEEQILVAADANSLRVSW